jgi:P-type Ca2+ transporter type 2C
MEARVYSERVEDVCARLKTNVTGGLSPSEAQARLVKDGPNALTHEHQKRAWQILLAQFKNLLVIILIVAAVVSFLLGDGKDAIAIVAIIVLNATLGFRQEYKAERAMAALKRLSAPHIKVRRDGTISEVDARDLVCGDLVLLEAGNLVAADCRLSTAASLKVQESALTGESEAVEKTTDALGEDEIAIGDRRNMVHMGTIVTYGRGEGIVTATGMQTELGHVATLLQETEDDPTPLTTKIEHLGKVLVWVAMGLITLVAVVGVLRGDDWKTVFLTAVSMAVAAVPEGLPAVVTIALALGAKRMLARQALIRNLPAVETLGSVTAICTDKTGTLTQNVMTVTCVELPSQHVVVGAGDPVSVPEAAQREVGLCLGGAALASDAVLNSRDNSAVAWSALGDPTEGALVVAAARVGLDKAVLDALLPRAGEAPFDSDRKRMSTLHRPTGTPAEGGAPVVEFMDACGISGDSGGVVFAKGAVGSILDVCTQIRRDGTSVPLDGPERDRIRAQMETLAGEGVRILGVAYRCGVPDAPSCMAEDLERDLTFLGLIGMMDPLREDVKASVAECQKAGIRPIMITGDHPAMARHIAKSLSMPVDGNVVTGLDIAAMSEEDLIAAVGKSCVFARVSPEDKLRIVDALQARGEIASMTGDGVNDAPALKSADIGVAMGITGTDVAKEASDMVLLDDRYATIVAAVREGRVIFDNICRFIRFILASNSGELLVMLMAPLFGMPLPLFPVQILWMNLVTDGLPALALGVEGAESDVMLRPPRDPNAPLIDWAMGRSVLWVGLLIAILSLWVGKVFFAGAGGGEAVIAHGHGGGAAAVWQTMLFTTMVLAQLFLAMAVRSSRESLFSIGVFSNRPMVAALAVTLVLHLGVIYVPVMQGFFKTTALSLSELGLCVVAGATVFVAVEVEKLILRLRHPVA